MRHFFCDSLKRFLMACALTVVGIFSATAANLPAGYTELEYIENDGASYLIVPYRVNNKTVFYCRYNEIQKGSQTASAVFGVTDQPSVSNANNGILRLLNGASSFNRMGWGDSTSGSIIDVSAPQYLDTWYEVLYDQNKLYQDGTLYATSVTDPSTVWSANYGLGIFARNGSSVTMIAKAKISSVWAKEAGVFVLNLIPAKRDSDGVLGMYDTVNDVFYTNRGTGSFTAGPVVLNPCRNLYNSATRTEGYYIGLDGQIATGSFAYSDYIPATPNTIYNLSGKVNGGTGNRRIHAYDSNKNWLQHLKNVSSPTGSYSFSGTTPANTAYIRISVSSSDTDVQLEQGETATAYVPYCATDGAIKIATTKYTEDAFAGLMTTLSEAITKVTNIVDTTVQQATEIGELAQTKQDRPDTDCPAGRKCLLIMGADNKPHWYLIQE